jgi:hypothetical protein
MGGLWRRFDWILPILINNYLKSGPVTEKIENISKYSRVFTALIRSFDSCAPELLNLVSSEYTAVGSGARLLKFKALY